MSESKNIVQDIMAGNANSAKTQIQQSLNQKALSTINDMKKDIGQNFFKDQKK